MLSADGMDVKERQTQCLPYWVGPDVKEMPQESRTHPSINSSVPPACLCIGGSFVVTAIYLSPQYCLGGNQRSIGDMLLYRTRVLVPFLHRPTP